MGPVGGCNYSTFINRKELNIVMSLHAVILLALVRVECNEYKGRYTRNIEDYEVVVPKKISEEGRFISYYLPHYYNIARVRRGADLGKVHYVVPIDGEEKIIELEPTEGFHAPGMVVEHHPVDARLKFNSIKIRKPRPTRCYYHGRVRGDPQSSAAITACFGLAGSIKVGAVQYLIEPVDDEGKPTMNVKHKHLLYKRSQRLFSNRSKCGTTGSFTTAFKQRMEWEEKYGKEVEASIKGAWDHDKQERDEHPRKRRFCTTCNPNDMKKCLTPHGSCSIPSPLFIELLLVVGPRVASSAFLADDVEQFINTIVNIAVKQFQDSTLGKPIVVKLVRVITIDYLYEELDAKKNNPQKVLQNFCQWQMHFNPRMEDHPNHHDYAIYIVKFESCQGEILGLTNMASMCRPDKSCAVVSEEGLLTGNIITHMMGHALGAEHDDSSTSSCAPVEPDGTTYHMGTNICGESSSWSVCSKQFISQFVKTHAGWCLTDLPTATDLTYPVLLPGQIYSAPEQCRINFEIDSYACMVGEFCKRLYCKINEKECISMGDPPAQGTQCGPNLWCFNGKCVHRGSRPGATNGEWGEWSHWSPCTKTCGGGIETAHRSCDSPAPARGGKMCPGKWLKSKMCNIGGCPDSGKGFLDEQCQRTNSKPYHGRKHNWVFFNQQIEDLQCVIICVNEMNEVAIRNPVAADGTFCKPAYKDVCIRGSCQPVGCDWGIGSNAKEDACGVCHGNGTECRIMQGFFGEHNVQGVLEFLKLPIGTSMVLVRETRPSPCFFFISNSMNHSFYLNSDREEQLFFTGTFTISGTVGVYQIKGNMERIFIKEPLGVPITISTVCVEEERSLGILYQYALPEPNTPASIPTYTWEFLSWEACPFPCGGGAQRATPVCVEAQGGEVEDCYCSQQARPPDKVRVCNKHPCVAKWWVGPWASCDCFHEEGVTTRLVMCAHLKEAQSTYITVVPEEECNPSDKPRVEKPCDPAKEREIWEKNRRQKRDITDIIPYSEAAEGYTVWDDIVDNNYPSMVNLRKMLHQLDPERVNDYAFLKKIGMINNKWQNKQNDTDKTEYSNTRVRVRRLTLLGDPRGKIKNITNGKPNNVNILQTKAIISNRKSVTEKHKASLGRDNKGVKVVQQPQNVSGTAKHTEPGKITLFFTEKYSEVTKPTQITTEKMTTTKKALKKVSIQDKVSTVPTSHSPGSYTVSQKPGNSIAQLGKKLTTHKNIGEFLKLAATSSMSHLTIPEVKNDPGVTPYSEYASETIPVLGKCWKVKMKTPGLNPTCLPPGEAQEPADAPPEIDFLNTSNIKIYVVPIMTTIRTIIQNDQELVLLETLAKWPVADELSVVEHWGDAARRELKIAKDKASMKNGKKNTNMVQD